MHPSSSYDQIESEIRRLLTAAKPGTALPEVSREASAFAMIRLVAGAPKERHVLTLIASDPGMQAYVFTFGP